MSFFINFFMFYLRHDCVLSVIAEVALGIHFGNLIGHEAFFNIMKSSLYPRIVSGIGNDFNVELQLFVEERLARVPIAIDKISSWRDIESVLLEKPLIYFHLPLVSPLPFSIQIDLAGLRSRLVVNDNDFPFWINPDIINCSGNQQIGSPVQIFYSFKGVPPGINIFVLVRHRINSEFFNQRMRSLFFPVQVEFLLQQRIDGAVQRERKAGRPAHPQAPIQIETLRTLHEQIYFRAAQLERLLRLRVENIA